MRRSVFCNYGCVVVVAGVVVVLLLPMPTALRKRRKRDGCVIVVAPVVADFTFVTTTLPSALVAMTMLPVAEEVVDAGELFAAAAVAAFFAVACATIARAWPLDLFVVVVVVVVVVGVIVAFAVVAVVVVIDGVALMPAVTRPADALTGATTLGVASDVAIGDGDEVAATVGVVMAADATVGVSAPVPPAV
ncbi:MAG: hypothetical protein QOI24_2514 [Acidobacteriota bacterium]|nr:hypothetical protein [Acidobacteriota bacterium]